MIDEARIGSDRALFLDGVSAPRPTRVALLGLLAGTGLAIVAALGPLVSAIMITIGVETQVGEASGLPDPRMLPTALEGVGAVALIFLVTRRPTGRLRAWCVALIVASLGTGNGAASGRPRLRGHRSDRRRAAAATRRRRRQAGDGVVARLSGRDRWTVTPKLEDAGHRRLAVWAADCAEHVLDHFERARPAAKIARRAIELGRAWARGEITIGLAGRLCDQCRTFCRARGERARA